MNILRLHDANSSVGSNELIILIARAGKRERSQNLNQRRLHNIKTYLTEFLGRDPETIVMAEGAPVDGNGRIEIYIAGKLADKLEVGLNEDLRAGSCDNTSPKDKLFYKPRSERSRMELRPNHR